MGINSLIYTLPLSGIEAGQLAILTFSISGKDEKIIFLEPPAGQRVPFVDPVHAMTVLFRMDGLSTDEAHIRAVNEFNLLRNDLKFLERPRLYQDTVGLIDVPECVPVLRLTSFLKSRGIATSGLIEFLEQANDVTCKSRVYRWPDNRFNRLDEMPKTSPSEAMIEFFIGLKLAFSYEIASQDMVLGEIFPAALLAWRESMRPVAKHLEQMLGEKVYHFSDLDDKMDDDGCHRFLALHCWCSILPESNFVKFLLEATGVPDVELLKAALIDPQNYSQPFTFNKFFRKIRTQPIKFRYIGTGQERLIAIVLRTEAARIRAAEIAMSKIGATVLFLAPQRLLSNKWIRKNAAMYCHGFIVWNSCDRPVHLLARYDELYIITDDDRIDNDQEIKLGKENEILVWLAHRYGFPLHLDSPSGVEVNNPVKRLEQIEIPALLRRAENRRREFLSNLKCLRVAAEYGSTGIWDGQLRNIPYELIDIPFPLIRRIAAWQKNYDDTLIPLLPETADDEWWENHEIEELNIARAIQDAMGDRLDVQIWMINGPVSINSIGMYLDFLPSKIKDSLNRVVEKIITGENQGEDAV